MPIQVIIKRKWETDKPEALIPLLTELRSLAEKQPGYISGETLRSLDDPADKYLVLSFLANGRRLTIGRTGCKVKKEETFRGKWIL